ncbi:hypothetical protein B0T12DRAFT_477692 [Alternaria alternata]|jgi:hypothetical protein|nr:hypothetical protein B0T12DRAFT_477692 [Alternaria alternata]
MTPRNGCACPGRRPAARYTRNSIWCVRDITHAVSDMSNPRKVTEYDTDQKAHAPHAMALFTRQDTLLLAVSALPPTRFTIHDSKLTKAKIAMTAVAGASPTAGLDRQASWRYAKGTRPWQQRVSWGPTRTRYPGFGYLGDRPPLSNPSPSQAATITSLHQPRLRSS